MLVAVGVPLLPIVDLPLDRVVEWTQQRRHRQRARRLGAISESVAKHSGARQFGHERHIAGPALAYRQIIAPLRLKSCNPSLSPTYPTLV
jgi:hypothetical protein